MKPAIPLLNPAFRYVPACATNISKRFAAERERIACERTARETARQVLQTQAAADCAVIAAIFAARREVAVVDLDQARQFRLMCDVSAGKK